MIIIPEPRGQRDRVRGVRAGIGPTADIAVRPQGAQFYRGE